MPSDACKAWLQKAAEDEEVLNLIHRAGGPWSLAAYHVQQAAEKLLNAVLIAKGILPPRSHDLVHLLSLSGELIPPEVDEAAAVTSAYAWLTRYPGFPDIAAEEILDAISNLAIIKNGALQIIG